MGWNDQQEGPKVKIFPVTGPYLGQVSSPVPKVKIPPNGFDEVLNWLTVRSRLQTRPRLNSFATIVDGKTVYAMRSFKDINGSFHTLVLTTQDAYFITAGPVLNALSFPSGVTDLGSVNRPFGLAALLNKIYFSNGASGVSLLYTNGSSALRVAGNVQGGARFLAVIGGHLMMAYTTEGSRDFQNRVRWCSVGNPDNWTGETAGFNNIFETPDEITGLVGASRSGFIFRTNGVTTVTATGIGANPFAFEHLATEPQGVGNFYPYSLASFGNRFTIFVAEDDIYGVTLPDFEPLGGNVRREIFADIRDTDTSIGPITGRILPNLGVGYDFLAYYLTIPKTASTTTWVLAIEERNWSKLEHAAGALSAMSTVYIT